MMRSLKSRAPAPPGGQSEALPQAPLGGSRAEALRRLQMGAAGLVAVLLLVGLASLIKERAAETETTTVAEAAATNSSGASPAAPDPLAEAGVVPDIPASPTAHPPAAQDAAGSSAPATVPGVR